MSAPRWTRALLRRLAPERREDEILGDLDEAHAQHLRRRGRVMATVLTTFETLDMALALLRQRGTFGGMSLLDFKLGMRMLVRYPGLTALGGLAIAFAIFAGAGTFEFLRQVVRPTLPFPDGDRLVAVQLWDARAGDDQRQALFDVGVWRDELRTIEELGAFANVAQNMVVDGQGAHLVRGATIDAVGFRLTGVDARLGRTLADDDALPGADPVVVIGHELWGTVFANDPDVVGRTVRMGTEAATVVGVMPEGFRFPVAHDFWRPLRIDAASVEPGTGPGVFVFGRLSAGTSMADAQLDVERVGTRLSTALPDTHEHIRPFVRPYAMAMLGLPAFFSTGLVSAVAAAWNLPLILFLALVCGNVALLMFARAAARESELVVRAALGAGRRRIVGQLFAEALVLAALGAAVGLAAAGWGMRWGYHAAAKELGFWSGSLPFWFQPELSLSTVVYVGVLTLIGAAIAGVLPALKATRGIGTSLRESSAGAGGLRFGGVWTFVIVAQLAVTVGFPAVTLAVGLEGREIQTFDLGIPAEEYLTARVTLPPPDELASPVSQADPQADAQADAAAAALTRARFDSLVRTTFADLEERLLAEPLVAGVTFAAHAPREYAGWHQIEVDGPTAPAQDERGHRMGSVEVEADFFRTLAVEPRSGRDFSSADVGGEPGVVVVNEAFVDYVLGGRNAVGLHLRYLAQEGMAREAFGGEPPEPSPWFEIVGVVQDLGSMSGFSSAVIYHPVAPGTLHPAAAILRVQGDADSFVPRLRAIALDVDPTLRIDEPTRLDRMVDDTVQFYRFWVRSLSMVSGVAVLLSLGGIFSVMSFTVARRTREIGVRVALGAPRHRIVLAIFRRPLTQVLMGLLAGSALTAFLMRFDSESTVTELAVFAAYLTFMAGICMLACVAPTRRALSITPSEALRTE